MQEFAHSPHSQEDSGSNSITLEDKLALLSFKLQWPGKTSEHGVVCCQIPHTTRESCVGLIQANGCDTDEPNHPNIQVIGWKILFHGLSSVSLPPITPLLPPSHVFFPHPFPPSHSCRYCCSPSLPYVSAVHGKGIECSSRL